MSALGPDSSSPQIVFYIKRRVLSLTTLDHSPYRASFARHVSNLDQIDCIFPADAQES